MQIGTCSSDLLVVFFLSMAIMVHTLNQLFDRLQERTGIKGRRVSLHNCRHYMATTQLAMGRIPLDVRRQMGHTTLMMTNHYASLTIEHIQ